MVDTSLVSSLFSPDDLPNNMGIFSDGLLNLSVDKLDNKDNDCKVPATDLKHVTYNPSLFELTDDDDGPGFPLNYKPPVPSNTDIKEDGLNTPELNTPLVQECGDDPMKFLMKRWRGWQIMKL